MTSSGTVSISIAFRYKPPRGREGFLVAGDSVIKSSAVIDAEALELRTIKAFVATPYNPRGQVVGTYFEGPPILYGSVQGAGSIMNSVTLSTLKGSFKVPMGTYHMGTRKAGTIHFGFLAVGA